MSARSWVARLVVAIVGGSILGPACGGDDDVAFTAAPKDAGGDGTAAKGGGGAAGTGVDGTATGGAPDSSAGAAGASGTAGAADGAAGDAGATGTGGAAGGGPCTAPQSCYSGNAADLSYGSLTACRAGLSYCINGVAGPCTGEVLPSTESCNGIDDDCNGTVDDASALGNTSCGTGACKVTVAACTAGKPTACVPGPSTAEICGNQIDEDCDGVADNGCGCIHVAPSGSDTTGTGSEASPLRTINAAIALANSQGPKFVCVASGPSCPSSSTYAEAVAMVNGVSVYGGYAAGSPWTRGSTCVTTIGDQDARGVYFGHSVTSPTVLDGFTVNAQNGNTTSAAITVEGSTGAVINANIITGSGGTTSYGINVIDSGGIAATPTITDSAITGGTGSSLAVGIRSLNSAPIVQSNCDGPNPFDTSGRCIQYGCYQATRFIRGRASGNVGGTGAQTYGIRLEASPGALIERNAICSSAGQGDVAAVRLSGSATGTLLRANHVDGGAGNQNVVNAVGFWADACGGASPWVLDNSLVSGNSGTLNARADGVRAVGDCHPRIDSNVLIVGGEESSNNDANGVYCAKDPATGTSSRCTVLNNTDIRGSSAGFPPSSTGIRCDDGACARIESNKRITAWQGMLTFGIRLGNSNTFVANNAIDAGCARTEGIGILAQDSYARIENNAIGGSSWIGTTGCASGSASWAPSSYGIRVVIGTGANEIDLNSNDVFALGTATACTGRALAFDVGAAAPAGPRGVVRNNILHSGACNTAYGLVELSASADPRVVENDDFWHGSASTALYLDENATSLTTGAGINALTDITAGANFSADPLFSALSFPAQPVDLHILAGSPCRNTGASAGAPRIDFEGDTRPAESVYDVGADEYLP